MPSFIERIYEQQSAYTAALHNTILTGWQREADNCHASGWYHMEKVCLNIKERKASCSV
jgi:hypothetical protein